MKPESIVKLTAVAGLALALVGLLGGIAASNYWVFQLTWLGYAFLFYPASVFAILEKKLPRLTPWWLVMPSATISVAMLALIAIQDASSNLVDLVFLVSVVPAMCVSFIVLFDLFHIPRWHL